MQNVAAIVGSIPARAQASGDAAPGYAGTLSAGLSGNPRLDDFEHNRKLLDPRTRIREYRKVARSHSPTAGSIDTMHTLIASHAVEVEVGPGQSEEAAEALRRYHGIGDAADDMPLCGVAWHDLVAHFADAPIQYGAAMMAVGYGETHDSGINAPRLEPRRAANLWEYHQTPRGDLAAVELRSDAMHVAGTEGVYIPRFDDEGRVRLIWGAWRGGTNIAMGEGFDGLPVLRSVLADAQDSLSLRQMMRVAAHLAAVGKWHAKVDFNKVGQEIFGQEWAGKTGEERTAFYQTYKTFLQSHLDYLANDVKPGIITGMHTEIGLLADGKAFDPARFIQPIDSTDRAVAERFWTAWLQQGRAGSGGSRSMVETQGDMLFRAVAGYVEWVIGTLRTQLHPTFYQINFPGLPVEQRPSIRVSGLKTPDFIRNAEAFHGYLDRVGVPLGAEAVQRLFTAFGMPAPDAADVPSAADQRAVAVGGALRTEAGQRAAGRGR